MTQQPGSSRRRLRLIVILLSLGASLVCAELGLRVLDLPRPERSTPLLWGREGEDRSYFVDDPDVFYRLSPVSAAWQTNSLGMRGYLPPKQKRDGEFRIVCLGDSSTAGLHVSYEETFGVRLARRLQSDAPGGLVTTILGAAPGWSTFQDLRLWNKDLCEYAPDLVILYAGACNDGLPALDCGDAEFARRRAEESGTLRIVQLARQGWRRLINGRFDPARAREDAQRGILRHGRRVELPEFRDNVSTLVSSARASGADVVLVVPGQARSTWRQQPHLAGYREAIRALAREQNTLLVDGMRALDEAGEEAFIDFVHPSPLGHECVAAAIESTLRAAGLPRLRALLARAPSLDPTIVIGQVAYGTADEGRPASIEIRGHGLELLTPADPIWVGDVWLASWSVRTDGVIAGTLAPVARPGSQVVTLATPRGVIRGPTITLAAMPLALRRVDATHVEVTLRTGANVDVVVFAGPERLREPRPTSGGPWHVAGADRVPGWPPWAQAGESALRGRTDAQGLWQGRVAVAPGGFVQGAVTCETRMASYVVTECVEAR